MLQQGEANQCGLNKTINYFNLKMEIHFHPLSIFKNINQQTTIYENIIC